MQHPFYSLPALQAVRGLLQKYQLTAQKSWGQHFLVSDGVYRDIVTACSFPKAHESSSVRIVEIGAGLGTLTSHLLQAGWPVVAVEREAAMCHVLEKELGGTPGFSLLRQNALTVRLPLVEDVSNNPSLETKPERFWVVGNLPYQIATPLVFHFLEFRSVLQCMVVMVQKEVAERMQASPGSSAYGVLSINLQMLANVELVREVPAGSFLPPPQVESAVLRLRPFVGTRFPVSDETRFRKVVQAAFSQRRKTLRNALKQMGGEKTDAWLQTAGVSPDVRAETLPIESFVRLSDTYPW